MGAVPSYAPRNLPPTYQNVPMSTLSAASAGERSSCGRLDAGAAGRGSASGGTSARVQSITIDG